MRIQTAMRRHTRIATLAVTAALVLGVLAGPGATSAGAYPLGGGAYPFFWDQTNISCQGSIPGINGSGGYAYIWGYPTVMTCPFPDVHGLVSTGRVWEQMTATGYPSTGSSVALPVEAPWRYQDCYGYCPKGYWSIYQGVNDPTSAGMTAYVTRDVYRYLALTTQPYFPTSSGYKISTKVDWYNRNGTVHSMGYF